MSLAQKFLNLLPQSSTDKILEVSKALGIQGNWLAAVMYFETGFTFSPATTNPIGSVGLIQFTRDKKGVEYKTINGVKYLLSDLKKMTFSQQMSVVQEYFKEAIRITKVKPKSFIDMYLLTFFPGAVGKSPDYVLETANLSRSIIAKQNPVFDKNKDGKLTKGEVEAYFKSMYEKKGFDFDAEINTVKEFAINNVATVGIAVAVFFYSYVAYSF